MKNQMPFLFLLTFLFFGKVSNAQVTHVYTPTFPITKNTPKWFKVFYTDTLNKVNIFYLDSSANRYLQHEEQKEKRKDNQRESEIGESEDIYYNHYKRWRIAIDRLIADDGRIRNEVNPFPFYKEPLPNSTTPNGTSSPSSTWSVLGPLQTYWNTGTEGVANPAAPWQCNIQGLAIAPSNSNILYASTETGAIFKSINKGVSWSCVTMNYNIPTASGIAVHPTNSNIVLAGGWDKVYITTDAGATWIEKTLGSGTCYKVVINPSNPLIALLAGGNGLYKTTDGGTTWSAIATGTIYDVAYKTDDANTVFMLKRNGSLTEFHKSTDGGATFTASLTGWNNKGITQDEGVRFAVTPQNADIIFAARLSNSPRNVPYIFKSTNAGASWDTTCTGTAGSNGSTNLPLGMSNGQGFYDLAIAINPLDNNQIITGTTSIYRSTNAGATFTAIGGYTGSFSLHPDLQKIAVNGSNTWIGTDGGLTYSTDFFGSTANAVCRTNGIFSSHFWGYTQGWNEDIVAGGRYHNGNAVLSENYPAGDAIQLGGGEEPTGHYMLGRPGYIAFSDIGGKVVPAAKDKLTGGFTYSKYPNGDDYGYNPSNIDFHPAYYKQIYSGTDNALWKSMDGGGLWTTIYDFGQRVKKFSISRVDPNYIYLITASPNNVIQKSTNGGTSWTSVSLPSGITNYRMSLTLSGTNVNELWITAPGASAGNRVFKSTDGGASWTNLTTATINAQGYTSIVHQLGTDGGVYLSGNNGQFFYRNNTMSDWAIFNNGLLYITSNEKVIPFYRDAKLRSAGQNGIWQVDFYEPSNVLVQPSVDKYESLCARDTFYFEDYSVLQHAGATWTWSFPGASYVSSTTSRNPKVLYPGMGTYTATLTITKGAFSGSKSINVIITGNQCAVDTTPGNCITLTAQYSGASVNNFIAPASNSYTMMAWVKPSSIIYFGGIISAETTNGTVALNTRYYNADSSEIGYHHPNGSWTWSSGLYLKRNEWTHVALVVEPNKISVYKNGIGASHTGLTVSASTFGKVFEIGNMIGWHSSRTFQGNIDEVAFYNQALTADQIRLMMHLTKQNPNYASQANNNLLSYYQFNENSSLPIYDKINNNHLSLFGSGASKTIVSTGPFGGGVSEKIAVTTGGVKNFVTPAVEIAFPSSGTYPNGDVYVNRINTQPDQIPATYIFPYAPKAYYAIRNYGTNATFSPLTSIKFNNVSGTNNTMVATPSLLKLFKRKSNDDLATWGAAIDSADVVTNLSGIGTVEFSSGLNNTSFSQYTIGANAATLPVRFITFKAKLQTNGQVLLSWTVAEEIAVDSYEIQRSADGINFAPIGTKMPTSNSLYTLLDNAPLDGINYYRLKMKNRNGTVEYWDVIKIIIKRNLNIKINPNPILNGWVNFTIEGVANKQNATIQLISVDGKIVQSQVLTDIISNRQYHFYTNNSGSYYLKIMFADGFYSIKKIVVVK
jgi:Concanavalin A-like lectin/glucanases superfamily